MLIPIIFALFFVLSAATAASFGVSLYSGLNAIMVTYYMVLVFFIIAFINIFFKTKIFFVAKEKQIYRNLISISAYLVLLNLILKNLREIDLNEVISFGMLSYDIRTYIFIFIGLILIHSAFLTFEATMRTLTPRAPKPTK